MHVLDVVVNVPMVVVVAQILVPVLAAAGVRVPVLAHAATHVLEHVQYNAPTIARLDAQVVPAAVLDALAHVLDFAPMFALLGVPMIVLVIVHHAQAVQVVVLAVVIQVVIQAVRAHAQVIVRVDVQLAQEHAQVIVITLAWQQTWPRPLQTWG
ncbi:hypothetical protein [Desulfocucumis palustris]|uniref:hypothetical protein n=1 Tax=Desulfocucumis palustris TaxID=1898651 RepID=UPI001E57BE0A|nr:hypothetical protein [Desulfocucumis palustris]